MGLSFSSPRGADKQSPDEPSPTPIPGPLCDEPASANVHRITRAVCLSTVTDWVQFLTRGHGLAILGTYS